jgi:hypothetical protein
VPRFPFRALMFLSSYAPLFLLLAYSNRTCRAVWIVLVAAALVSVVGLAIVLVARRNDQGPRLTVQHSRPKDGEVLAYIATYLVPFLGLNLGDGDDLVLFCGFLVVLGIVYINSNMLFVNPLLSLSGFHTFEVSDPEGHEYSVITRRRDFNPGEVIRPSQVDRYVRVEVCRVG